MIPVYLYVCDEQTTIKKKDPTAVVKRSNSWRRKSARVRLDLLFNEGFGWTVQVETVLTVSLLMLSIPKQLLYFTTTHSIVYHRDSWNKTIKNIHWIMEYYRQPLQFTNHKRTAELGTKNMLYDLLDGTFYNLPRQNLTAQFHCRGQSKKPSSNCQP